MSKKENRAEYNQAAMKGGTILGIIWIAATASYIGGLNNPILLFLSMILAFASPFYAGAFAIKFRKNECMNTMTFLQAWLFVMIMYICASLLLAIVHYIYFAFIDNGYLAQIFIENANNVLEQDALLTAEGITQIETAKKLIQTITPTEWSISFLSMNLMTATFLAPVTALFVRKNPTTKNE